MIWWTFTHFLEKHDLSDDLVDLGKEEGHCLWRNPRYPYRFAEASAEGRFGKENGVYKKLRECETAILRSSFLKN
jgi:hypothetical protein